MNYSFFALALMVFEIKNIMADFVMVYIRKDQARDRRYYLYNLKMKSLDPSSEAYARMFIASLKHPPAMVYLPGMEYFAYFAIHLSVTFFIIVSYLDTFRKVDQSESLILIGLCASYSLIKTSFDAFRTYYKKSDKTAVAKVDNVIQLKKAA